MSNEPSDSRFAWETIQRLGLVHPNGDPVNKQDVFDLWSTEPTRAYVPESRTAMAPYLPDEILLNIFTNVEPDTLHALCRTNKTCCNLAQPLLYNEFYHSYKVENLPLFLRTLIEQPHLALHVYSVKLFRWEIEHDIDPDEDDPWYSSRRNIAPRLASIFQSALPKLHLSVHLNARLLASLDSDSQDAQVTLLIALCPNLDFLELECPYPFAESLLMDLAEEHSIDNHGQRPQFLTRLRKLHIYRRDEGEEDIVELEHLSLLLSAPKLITFNAEGLGPEAVCPISPTLQHINLTDVDLDATTMAHILTSCPALQTFTIEWRGYYSYSDFEWNRLGKSLRKHGRTLQNLSFDTRNFELMESQRLMLPLGSLKPLESLKHLTVPDFALMGQDDDSDDNYLNFAVPRLVDILPNSLETLTITPCTNDADAVERAVTELTNDARFSRLRNVCIFPMANFRVENIPVTSDATWELRSTGQDQASWHQTKL